MHKLAIPFFFLILVSCNSNTIVSETKTLPGYWDKDEVIEFAIPKLDSLTAYDVFIHLRNTNEYKYNNLFLIASMNFPNGKTVTDTLEYKMAYPNGEWMGEGIGPIKENKLWYKEGFIFSEGGIYTITIAQAVRNNGDIDGVTQLEGITDVGFSIAKTLQQ